MVKPEERTDRHPLASKSMIQIFAGVALILLISVQLAIAGITLSSSTQEDTIPPVSPTATPTDQLNPTPTATPRPIYRPTITPTLTPIPTPTPSPEPTPSPSPIYRWCDADGCYDGLPPTPTPTPTPTPEPTPSPTPTPLWIVYDLKCAVSDAVADEVWAQEYTFQCACDIKEEYELGDYYNVWEACQSPIATGWKTISCACMNEICAARPDLC